jgi:NADPH:quinone reductase-like Zn-dependent oxidoreductase
MARALAITGRDEQAVVHEIPQLGSAELGPDEIRVAVEAASLNGIDAAAAAGYLWERMPHTFPVVLGRDFAGRVEEVGTAVTGVQVGDRVAGVIGGLSLGKGAIAESVTIDAAAVAGIPAGVSAAQAAGVGLVGLAASALIDALQLTGEDVVLVSGATGGVGAIAVQLAKATGAKVIGTARADGGAEDFIRGLGAAEVVDYTGDLATAIKAVAPDGVTAVVHAAGDPAVLAPLLQPNGRLASVLYATNEQAGRDDITVLPVMSDVTGENLALLLEATASGAVQVPVARTYSLHDAASALTDFGRHKLGKLVVIN